MKSDHYEALKEQGLLDQAREWLKENPPPGDWKASPWAWARLEMPLGLVEKIFGRP